MDDLDRAIQTLKNGDKRQAQMMLAAILRQTPENETAWFWMSRAVEEKDKRRMCLERALRINPSHYMARREMKLLGFETPAAAEPTRQEPAAYLPPAPARIAPPEPVKKPRPRYCSNCGEEVEGNFCSNCGQPVHQSRQTPVPERPAPPPPAPVMVQKIREPAVLADQETFIATPVAPLDQPRQPRPEAPAIHAPIVTRRRAEPASRFTAKRMVAAIGMAFIILAGLLTWRQTSEWKGIFLGWSDQSTIGLTTGPGIVSTLAAVLGMIVLFATDDEGRGHMYCALLSIVSAVGAAAYMAGTGDAAAGVGIYMVFLGTAITLGCFLIPSAKKS